jgi:hypothetical protein
MTFRGFAIVVSLLLAVFGIAAAADASGQWTATFNTQVGEQKYTWDLKADGAKLTGNELKITRKVAGAATEEGVAKRVS